MDEPHEQKYYEIVLSVKALLHILLGPCSEGVVNPAEPTRRVGPTGRVHRNPATRVHDQPTSPALVGLHATQKFVPSRNYPP